MFLSKLTLDPGHPQARWDLSSPYEMHRTLVRAYADDSQMLPPRFLWRLESRRLEPSSITPPSAVLLVQSDVPADWSALDVQPDYALEILDNKPVNLEKLITDGGYCRFRLLANPTVTRQGRRYGLAKE